MHCIADSIYDHSFTMTWGLTSRWVADVARPPNRSTSARTTSTMFSNDGSGTAVASMESRCARWHKRRDGVGGRGRAEPALVTRALSTPRGEGTSWPVRPRQWAGSERAPSRVEWYQGRASLRTRGGANPTGPAEEAAAVASELRHGRSGKRLEWPRATSGEERGGASRSLPPIPRAKR